MSSVQHLQAQATARTRRFTPDLWLIPAAMLGIILLLSLIRPGIAGTADGLVHLLRTLEVAELMKSGNLYPQWAPDFYFGYGYPFFLFYAPGVHILAAVLSFTGLGVTGGLVAVQVLSVVLYGVGAYLAARTLYSGLASQPVVSMAALGAAALYVFAPLRMRELFSQGNLSQLVALSLLPWCLWALINAVRRASLRWTAVAGLLLAALLYAHHPSAFLAFPILFALGLVCALLQSSRGRSALLLCVAFAVAVCLSAPFWLPWLLESSYGSLQRMETGFNAASNLVPPDQLFSPALVLDTASINSPRPLTLGLLQAVLAGLGLVGTVWLLCRAKLSKAEGGWLLLAVAVLLGLCVLLMLPLTGPIWTRLPLAKFIAFPWRLLGPAGLLAALLGAVPLLLLPERPAAYALAGFLVLAPLSVAVYLFPAAGLWSPTPSGGLTVADIGRYEAGGGSRGTASANEYLPRWVQDPNPPTTLLRAYEAGTKPRRLDESLLPEGSRVQAIKSAPLEDVYRLSLPKPATVAIQRFYYPGWQAWINGQPASIRPSSPFGLIELDAPAGDSELRVAWGTTPPRTAGWVLFGLGLLVTAWLLLKRGRRPDVTEGPEKAVDKPAAKRTGGWLAPVAVILVLAGLKAWWVEPHTGWFRLQSPVDSPAGMMHPLHVRFTNGVELLGYDLPRGEVKQGGELKVRLYWRTHQPLAENLMSYLHLDAPVTQETWVNVTKQHAGDMPAKGWPLGFYVFDDFRVKVPSDTSPVRADLRVGLLDEQGARVPLLEGGDSVLLNSVTVQGSGRPTVGHGATEAGYRLGDSITLEAYHAELVAADPAGGRNAPGVRLTLYWRADRPLGTDYTVFAHLQSAGDKVEQGDGPACSGACPTTAWTPGGLIADTRIVPVPPGAAMDALEVLVGLYDPQSGRRLPVIDRQGARLPDDAIRLKVTTPATR